MEYYQSWRCVPTWSEWITRRMTGQMYVERNDVPPKPFRGQNAGRKHPMPIRQIPTIVNSVDISVRKPDLFSRMQITTHVPAH